MYIPPSEIYVSMMFMGIGIRLRVCRMHIINQNYANLLNVCWLPFKCAILEWITPADISLESNIAGNYISALRNRGSDYPSIPKLCVYLRCCTCVNYFCDHPRCCKDVVFTGIGFFWAPVGGRRGELPPQKTRICDSQIGWHKSAIHFAQLYEIGLDGNNLQ